MTSRHRLFLVAGFAAAIPVILFLTLLLVPDSVLQDLVARLAQQQGYSFRAQHFGKAFPLGVQGSGILLSGEKGPLLKADKASVRLGLIPLLTGKILLTYRAAIGPGEIHGEFSPRNNEFTIEARGIRLGDIPFFASVTGADVAGELFVACRFREKGNNPGGELRVEVKKAHLTAVKISGLPLPEVDNGVIRG